MDFHFYISYLFTWRCLRVHYFESLLVHFASPYLNLYDMAVTLIVIMEHFLLWFCSSFGSSFQTISHWVPCPSLDNSCI